jgi:hypothetical protein
MLLVYQDHSSVFFFFSLITLLTFYLTIVEYKAWCNSVLRRRSFSIIGAHDKIGLDMISNGWLDEENNIFPHNIY